MSLGAEVDSWDDIEVSKSEDVRDFNQPQTAPSYHRSAKKSYIPQRAYRRYLTNPWIVGAGVTLLITILILIIVFSTVSLGSDGTEPSELRPKPGGAIRDGLYLFGNGSLWNACVNETNNNNGGEAVLRRVRQAEDTPYDFLDSATTIFGVNNSILSVSSNNDDSAAEVLFQDPRFQPQSVAVDRLTGKVYALDKQAGTLLVVDVASRNFTILMSDLLAPHEIVLDPARGEMFVLQLATSIVRANMDGSARRNIVSYMNISALAIDRGRQRLYWINDDRQIQSADYHGNDRVTLFTDHTRIASLAVHGDRLYWLWPATAGESSNNSTLWRCRLSANDTSACSEHTVQPIPGLSNITSIRSFSSPPSSTNASSNHPCSVQNGGCQQLCLLSSPSRAGRSCGCYLGHRQKPRDSRGCEPADVFLLYVANSYARAQLAEESHGWSGVDVILPTKLSLRPLQRKSVLDFEYDWFNDALYFSDDSNIYATSLRGWSEQRTLLTVASGYYYEDMAYDWVSGNVYYTEASLSPGNKHRLMMFSERNPRDFRRTVASFNYYDEFGVKGAPYSTLMDSIRGVLYFSAADTSGRDRVRNIYELAENGTRLDGRLSAKYVHEHRILALDQSAGRIYWIWEAERNRATLKWTETREPGVVTRRLDVDVDEPLRSVGVQGDWLYLGTARKISRVNKDTAEDAERLVPRYVERAGLIISGGPYERSSQDIDGFRVIEMSRSFPGPAEFLRNVCAESRCQQICYAGDRSQDLRAMTKLTEPSCDCADNLRLSEDGACF